jgi:hypothetical protein
VAKRQRSGSKEARKPKKAQPPKPNAARAFIKNAISNLLKS